MDPIDNDVIDIEAQFVQSRNFVQNDQRIEAIQGIKNFLENGLKSVANAFESGVNEVKNKMPTIKNLIELSRTLGKTSTQNDDRSYITSILKKHFDDGNKSLQEYASKTNETLDKSVALSEEQIGQLREQIDVSRKNIKLVTGIHKDMIEIAEQEIIAQTKIVVDVPKDAIKIKRESLEKRQEASKLLNFNRTISEVKDAFLVASKAKTFGFLEKGFDKLSGALKDKTGFKTISKGLNSVGEIFSIHKEKKLLDREEMKIVHNERDIAAKHSRDIENIEFKRLHIKVTNEIENSRFDAMDTKLKNSEKISQIAMTNSVPSTGEYIMPKYEPNVANVETIEPIIEPEISTSIVELITQLKRSHRSYEQIAKRTNLSIDNVKKIYYSSKSSDKETIGIDVNGSIDNPLTDDGKLVIESPAIAALSDDPRKKEFFEDTKNEQEHQSDNAKLSVEKRENQILEKILKAIGISAIGKNASQSNNSGIKEIGGIGSKVIGKIGSLAASAGSYMTGGLGMTGLLGSNVGAIGGLGAGAIATTGALALGTAAVGAYAGYKLQEIIGTENVVDFVGNTAAGIALRKSGLIATDKDQKVYEQTIMELVGKNKEYIDKIEARYNVTKEQKADDKLDVNEIDSWKSKQSYMRKQKILDFMVEKGYVKKDSEAYKSLERSDETTLYETIKKEYGENWLGVDRNDVSDRIKEAEALRNRQDKMVDVVANPMINLTQNDMTVDREPAISPWKPSVESIESVDMTTNDLNQTDLIRSMPVNTSVAKDEYMYREISDLKKQLQNAQKEVSKKSRPILRTTIMPAQRRSIVTSMGYY